jgi:hypothetical protein
MVALDVGLELDFGLANQAANLIVCLPHATVDCSIAGGRSTNLSVWNAFFW